MAIHFISDLHLDPQRPDVVEGFLAYLQTQAQNADALYILGDFFEAWIGDDFSNTFTQIIIKALKKYSDRNIPVYFMHGNRDFLIGKQFTDQTGSELLTDPSVIDLYGKKALLMHGDTLCTGDTEYLNFRQMVRNPDWQKVFLEKSLQERLTIAQNLREVSKEKTDEKKNEIMDVTQSTVEQVMAKHQVNLLIHGHTHRPAKHELMVSGSHAERIVLGDWGVKGWHIVCDENGLELTNFPLSVS